MCTGDENPHSDLLKSWISRHNVLKSLLKCLILQKVHFFCFAKNYIIDGETWLVNFEIETFFSDFQTL